jgi:hypothetical protein
MKMSNSKFRKYLICFVGKDCTITIDIYISWIKKIDYRFLELNKLLSKLFWNGFGIIVILNAFKNKGVTTVVKECTFIFIIFGSISFCLQEIFWTS